MTHLEIASTTSLVSATHPVNSSYQRSGKRVLDIILGLILLPFVAFVILTIVLVHKLSGGDPFFGHERVGKNGHRFLCWKLRTMSANSDQILKDHLRNNPAAAKEWARTQKLSVDPRITPFGQFLRRTSLDELPQIWNVLRGEMSFVGPRPVTQEELHHYGAARTEFLSVSPGITGIWQINGRANGCYKERVQMDLSYCNAATMVSDLGLIAKTALVVLKATGR